MAANGISRLPTKEQRQIAKLDLAAEKRGESYDRDLLPTKYIGNDVYNNPNIGGLQPHRPWIIGTSHTAYPQRTNYAFDFITPPTTGTVWNDDTNQVTANINGTGARTSNYGGGIVFDGNGTYLEINDITDSISTMTISIAADFESSNSNWNPVYHGGPYGNADVFAYMSGGNTDSIAVGTSQTFEPGSAIVNNGLAWWDFVYDGTTVTVYKNTTRVISGTLNSTNTGFTQKLLVGARYDAQNVTPGDFLNGTIYRIKCELSALSLTQIITQYNGIRTTYSLPAPSLGSKLTIATNYDGGLVGWSSQSLAVAYNNDILSTFAVGSTITFQDNTVATITQLDPYGPEYIDIYWDTPTTGTLFPIILKTIDYVSIQLTAYVSGWNPTNNWLLPDVLGNPDLSEVGISWTVSGPSGYTATVTGTMPPSGNYVIIVDTTPTEAGDYTFTSP